MKNFIPNIDDANIRIAQLERELGLKPSRIIDEVDAANERIEELELEAQLAQEDSRRSTKPAAPHQSTKGLSGIRRAIAANGGTVVPTHKDEGMPKGGGLARAIAANKPAR